MGAPRDQPLVTALRRGDVAAFNRVHEQCGPRIWSFLARMCGRRDVAEDVYQETWIKLALHAPRLAEDTDIAAWLYTVARNLARSERRSTRARPGGVDVADGLPHGGASPYDWAAATETQAHLEEALAGLPAPFREVLLLVVVDGLEPERAAKVLDLSHEALRQRLARARAKLAERLAELSKAPKRPVKE
jgi:RNA polymerase sigma-70 factor (ECF subfamily)